MSPRLNSTLRSRRRARRCSVHRGRHERDRLIGYMDETMMRLEDIEYGSLKEVEEKLKAVQKDFSCMRKSLMEDIRSNAVNMNTGYLYLNVLQESEQMAIALKQMIRASRKFQTA